jgi:hypothetical protein
LNPLSLREREGPIDAVDGREWGYGAGQLRLVTDGGEDGRERPNDLLVREAKDTPTQSFDLLLPMVVVELLVIIVVDIAVEFDDQPQRFAGEVGEVAADGVLASESQAVEARGAEVLPEDGFGARLPLAEIPGAGGSSLGRHGP